eukprot:SAG31_NODE_3969_length_3708_cov_2.601829_3_plen_228_part_00
MRLDNAKEQFGKDDSKLDVVVRLHYHPFMIDPGTQPDGEDYMAYNRRRWGSDGWTRSMKVMGRKEGAPYANWKTWPNTTHCSRALMLAGKRGLGDKLIGQLYDMCYEQGENVSLKETVARAVDAAGVPGGADYILGDEVNTTAPQKPDGTLARIAYETVVLDRVPSQGVEELQTELRTATVPSGKRVSAAPTFSIRVAGSPVGDFSGAQETSRWLSILEQCAEMFDS